MDIDFKKFEADGSFGLTWTHEDDADGSIGRSSSVVTARFNTAEERSLTLAIFNLRNELAAQKRETEHWMSVAAQAADHEKKLLRAIRKTMRQYSKR